ncbi:hypothetical protein BJ912DRAFT_1070927 [Pholiota molesta]|nr:hypothetical protein BJ912DRAFT_1070927 [Pholiota molesta]
MANQPDKLFIAKSFIPTVIKDQSNAVYILQELIRIKCLQSFAKDFQNEADLMAVEITDFLVSDAFIITLNAPNSWLATDYLVEPLWASTAVVKFSGTFAEKTACQLIFVDLQGSIDYKPGEPKIMVLFDPMTHSPFQATWLGDFGIQGIQDFIDNHECSIICGNLSFADKEALQEALNIQSELVNDSKEAGTFENEHEVLTIEKESQPPGGNTPSDDGNEEDPPKDTTAEEEDKEEEDDDKRGDKGKHRLVDN